MQAITRTAINSDIPRLAELWHEKIILQQQFDHHYRLMPNSLELWSTAMAEWLENPLCAVHVGETDKTIYGYAIGWVQASPPGLTPEREGVITDLTIDPHSGQNNLGSGLVNSLKQWFQRNGISHILVQVPHLSPVEQAFWRGIGASMWLDVMWMKL